MDQRQSGLVGERAERVGGVELRGVGRIARVIAPWEAPQPRGRARPTDGNPLFDSNRARVIVAGRALFAAAQRAHEVRDDLALEQVLDMVIAIATIRGETRYLKPVLQTALDGLRPATSVKPA
ncbi:MAG TPA: hypothetical protein VGS16_12335 [Candidatus Dormibacteraeota bacterium]|nr:hypothetical protein [Candidatus Dormibacteraeota bacterium]